VTTIRVLHVDDNREFVEMAAELLGDDRFGVATETSPETALDRLRTEAFDCVVCDYDMPEMTGLDLLERVREVDPDLPFVLFTGKGSEEVAAEAVSKGVTDYLQKRGGTETYDILRNRIENAVERRRARAEAERTRRFLEKVVEHATDVIATVDANGEVVFVSGSVEGILGYTPAEVRERGPFDLIHPEDRERIEHEFAERMADPDHPTGIRHRAIGADGEVVELEARAYNLVDDPDVGAVLIYSRRDDGSADGPA
jgi:PAS domain S-box-containing protein